MSNKKLEQLEATLSSKAFMLRAEAQEARYGQNMDSHGKQSTQKSEQFVRGEQAMLTWVQKEIQKLKRE